MVIRVNKSYLTLSISHRQVLTKDAPTSVMLGVYFNSLASEKHGYYHKFVTFKPISRTDILSISGEIPLRWKSQELTDA